MLLLKKTKTDQPVTLLVLVLLQSCGLKTLPSQISKTHSTFSLTPTHSRQSAAMAAAKAISQTTSCLLSKTPFALKHKSHITNLCFGTKRVAFPSKRLFSCRAIYNPQVQITEEGQPETLDYRVFFVNNSGKKVLFFIQQKKFYFVCLGCRKMWEKKTIQWENLEFNRFQSQAIVGMSSCGLKCFSYTMFGCWENVGSERKGNLLTG